MEDGKQGKAPSHIAYSVRENADGSAYFNRVGSAFPHKDGQGFSVVLDAVPVDGRITLRSPKERIQDMRDDKPRAPSQNRDRGGR